MAYINLEKLGGVCREWRTKQGKAQTTVASDTGYSQENVSAFERGLNDNVMIFLWYIQHGLTFDDLIAKGAFDNG